MKKVNRREILMGAASAVATVPMAGEASATGAPDATAEFVSPPVAKIGFDKDEYRKFYHALFMQVRNAQRRQEQLVQDALERDGRFDLTAREALLLFDVAQTQEEIRPIAHYGWGPYDVPTVTVFESLLERGFVSARRVKAPRGVKVVLRKKGQEVADFVQQHCIERLDMLMAYMMEEKLAATSDSLNRLSVVWKDVVLYRL